MTETFLRDRKYREYYKQVFVKETYSKIKGASPAVNVEAYSDLNISHVTIVHDLVVVPDRAKSKPESFRHATPQQAARVAAAIMQACLKCKGLSIHDHKAGMVMLREAMQSL